MGYTRMVVGTALVLLLTMAGPASAASAALVDMRSGSNGPYEITATCSAVIGAVTGFNELTYVVEAQATAHDSRWTTFSTRKDWRPPDLPGMATTVICQVVDSYTGEVYGQISAGLPGPAAVAAGDITVPTSATVHANACGSAIFADGGYVSSC